MIRRRAEMTEEIRENIRGGHGRARSLQYLWPGDMAGVKVISRVTLDPGASIGQHPHADDEELYLVLEGTGTGYLDGEAFPVGPGDAFLCREGHSHGLTADPGPPLSFVAILSRE